jgi:hypothetical protein
MHRKSFSSKGLSVLLSMSLLGASVAPAAQAAVIGTQVLIEAQDHTKRLARVEAKLARAEIHKQMIAMGVDATEADARLAALSNEELKVLEEKLESLPAGAGVLEVIGVVFVVLLILDLVGVTNVFSKI